MLINSKRETITMDNNYPFVDWLDKEFAKLTVKPKGIQVSQDLFDALCERGRISAAQSELTNTPIHLLDSEIIVVVMELPNHVHFRFPPE